MITIRFVTGADIVSDGIRKFEFGYWATHAEAVMPDGTLLGAHAKGGVMARQHDYDNGQFTRELYVSMPATAAETDAFHAFLRAQLGKPYDFKAIEAFAASPIVGARDWQTPDAWFCSELQAAALCYCGLFPPHLADEFNHITPRDLLLIVSGRLSVAA